MNQNKKPSEPVDEERRAELELELQIGEDIRALSEMMERQREINRERNEEYRKIRIATIICQSLALLFAVASLITTVVKAAL